MRTILRFVSLAVSVTLSADLALADPPEIFFRIYTRYNGTMDASTAQVAPGSWSHSSPVSGSGYTITRESSGTSGTNSISLTLNYDFNRTSGTAWINPGSVGQNVEVYSLHRSTLAVSESASANVSVNHSSTLTMANAATFSAPGLGTVSQVSLSGTGPHAGTDSDAPSSSTTNRMGCNTGYSTGSHPDFPGVTYYKVPSLGGGVTASASISNRSGTAHHTSSGSYTLTVTPDTTPPTTSVTGPLVGGISTPNPTVGNSVTFTYSSVDPTDSGFSSNQQGICSTVATMKLNGTTVSMSTSASSGVYTSTFTPTISGEYTLEIVVTDNEGQVTTTTVPFPVGGPRSDCPQETSASATECMECGTSGSTTCVNSCTGNGTFTAKDPAATRGHPLACNVSINTLASPSGWITRPQWLGNASFTYGIYVTQGLKILPGTTTPVTRWIVIDGDGDELDFGPVTSGPTTQPGHFSNLTGSFSSGFVLTQAGPPGSLWKAGNYEYEFDSTGRLQTLTDPSGNIQELTYDGSNRPTLVTDLSSNRTIEFQYDTSGAADRIVENGGASVTHLTYSSGLLTGIDRKDSLGTTVRSFAVTYNTDGDMETVTPDGNTAGTATFVYTDSGHVISGKRIQYANVTYPSGSGSKLSYSVLVPSGYYVRTTKTNAKGGLSQFDFDTSMNLKRVILPDHTGTTVDPTFTMTYDANHNVTSWTNGTNTFDYTYNSLGLRTQFDNNAGGVWNYAYSGVDLTSITDSIGTYLTLGYTDSSNPHSPTTLTDAGGNTWTRTYNGYGQLLTVTPPTGSPTGARTWTYEENTSSPDYGYLRTYENGDGDITTFDSYTPLGDLTSVTTEPVTGVFNTTQFAYDGAQRVTQITHDDAKTSERVYTGRDLTETTDEGGVSTTYESCPECGRLTDIHAPLSKDLHWELDTDNDLTEFLDARSKTTTYDLGLAGELAETIYPDSSGFTYEYESTTRLKNIFNSRGNRIQNNYDTAGRLWKQQFTLPSATQSVITYNADDTIDQITDQVGAYNYNYFSDRRLQEVTYSITKNSITVTGKVAYTYNPDGTVATMSWVNGSTTVASWSYGYDGAGRVTSVTNNFGETTSYSYDDEGKLLTQTNQNGTSTDYAYNHSRGWPTSLTHKLSGTPFASYALEYDGGANTVGNLTEVTELSGDVMTYVYDDLYRLTEESRSGTGSYTNEFAYDLAGNVEEINSSTFASYDDANKISSLASGTVGYDADGNMTSLAFSGGSSGTFSYEHRSKMSQEVSGGTTYAYGYNALGLRAVRTSPGTRFYIFSGTTLIGEYDGSTPEVAYTWGADGLVSKRKLTTTAASHWYHFGPQGETREMTNSSGAVTDTYRYNAYGKLLASSGSTVNPYKYGGKYGYYSDGGMSLMLATHRWYSPELMRWTSKDPTEYDDGDNLYSYVANNPTGWFDHEGLARRPGKTPPSRWPQPPPNVVGTNPKWDSDGYWKKGKGGIADVVFDPTGHGEPHWDEDTPGGGNKKNKRRWRENGEPVEFVGWCEKELDEGEVEPTIGLEVFVPAIGFLPRIPGAIPGLLRELPRLVPRTVPAS